MSLIILTNNSNNFKVNNIHSIIHNNSNKINHSRYKVIAMVKWSLIYPLEIILIANNHSNIRIITIITNSNTIVKDNKSILNIILITKIINNKSINNNINSSSNKAIANNRININYWEIYKI